MRWLIIVIVAVLAFVGLSAALERLARTADDEDGDGLPQKARKAGV